MLNITQNFRQFSIAYVPNVPEQWKSTVLESNHLKNSSTRIIFQFHLKLPLKFFSSIVNVNSVISVIRLFGYPSQSQSNGDG